MKTITEIQIELLRRGYSKNLVLSEDTVQIINESLAAKRVAIGAAVGSSLALLNNLKQPCSAKCFSITKAFTLNTAAATALGAALGLGFHGITKSIKSDKYLTGLPELSASTATIFGLKHLPKNPKRILHNLCTLRCLYKKTKNPLYLKGIKQLEQIITKAINNLERQNKKEEAKQLRDIYSKVKGVTL